ncbi:MAG: O-antigen ligase family protein [Chlorobi bacterium]|nr:O-antigen ligase family protein [Chlorobiota bacterium]
MALIYYFIVTIVDTEIKLRVAIWTMIFFMTIVAGMGILQAHGTDITGMGMSWASDKKVWQIRGIGNFDNPNDLAYSVVLIVPFAAGLFTQWGKIFRQITGALLMMISIYCIYLTRSRGGILSLAACLAFWFYFRLSNKSLKRVGWLLALIGVVAAVTIQASGYKDDASAMGRVEAWVAGMEMFSSHPLIGTGKNQFMEHHKRDSHNSFVEAGAELGLVGLYAYIGVLYSTMFFLLKSASENAGTDDEQRMYVNGFLGYVASYCVASLFSSRTYDLVILLIIALVSANSRLYMAKSMDGPLAPAYEITLWNKKVVLLTLLTLVLWKLFLIQVY